MNYQILQTNSNDNTVRKTANSNRRQTACHLYVVHERSAMSSRGSRARGNVNFNGGNKDVSKFEGCSLVCELVGVLVGRHDRPFIIVKELH